MAGINNAMVPITDASGCVTGWALRTTSAAPPPRAGATTTTTTPAAAPPGEYESPYERLVEAIDRLIAALEKSTLT